MMGETTPLTSVDAGFAAAGFLRIDAVVPVSSCDQLCADPTLCPADGVGSRALLAHPRCCEVATLLQAHPVVAALLPADPLAVLCTLFNKSPEKNWRVPLHQDLSIPVRARIESLHCSGWSEKEGHWFVQPPRVILEQLVAVRVHLDASTAENGPLRVVPGSHRSGRLSDADAEALRERLGEVPVHAARGAAVVMRPLLLHASSKVMGNAPRRVLQFLFGPRQIGHGLEWGSWQA